MVITSAIETVDRGHLVFPEPEDEPHPVPGHAAGHVAGQRHRAAHHARDL